jgi:hypothetical protein
VSQYTLGNSNKKEILNMKKGSKKLRKATDDFVLDNEDIARQIVYDVVELLAQKEIDLTPSEKRDVIIDLMLVLYRTNALQRVSDRRQE